MAHGSSTESTILVRGGVTVKTQPKTAYGGQAERPLPCLPLRICSGHRPAHAGSKYLAMQQLPNRRELAKAQAVTRVLLTVVLFHADVSWFYAFGIKNS